MPLRSERQFIGKSRIKSGMMIEFNYRKTSGESGTYTVLVVDPDRQNDHASQPQLHGYVIDKLTDEDLIKFFASFRKEINMDVDDRHATVVQELNTEDAYRTFRSSRYLKDRPYRTFNLSGISSVRQILIGMVD